MSARSGGTTKGQRWRDASRGDDSSSDGSSSSSGSSEPSSPCPSGSSDDSEGEDACWLPWARSFLPRRQQAAGAGASGTPADDPQLAAARRLLQRQLEAEAAAGGVRRLPRWQRGVGWEQPKAHGHGMLRDWLVPPAEGASAHQLALMEAAARCLAAVSAAAWRLLLLQRC